jgi:hypothetical protein
VEAEIEAYPVKNLVWEAIVFHLEVEVGGYESGCDKDLAFSSCRNEWISIKEFLVDSIYKLWQTKRYILGNISKRSLSGGRPRYDAGGFQGCVCLGTLILHVV